MEIIAFDCETHLIKPGMLAPKMVLASFSTDGVNAEVLLREAAVSKLSSYLDSDENIFVGANTAYDFGVFLAEAPELLGKIFNAYEQGRVYDVQIQTALHAVALGRLGADINTGKSMRGKYSLAACVQQWLGRNDAKENDEYRLRFHELDGVPLEKLPPTAVQYAKDDAINTWLVFEKQRERGLNAGEVLGKGITHGAFQARAAWALHLSSLWGIKKDFERIDEMQSRLEAEWYEVQEQFKAAGILRADGSEDQGRLRVLVDAAYGDKAPKTATNRTQTTREVLENSGDALLESYAQAGASEKILSTYLPALRTKTPRYSARANVLLETGRTSYEGLIQTMPRKGGVRECFVATPGYVLCSVDYAALELATLAQVALWTVGSSEMAAAINAGRDLHSDLAAQMLSMTYDEFRARLKQGERKVKDFRQAAKAANFGFPGGMGPARFVKAKRSEGFSLCAASGDYSVPCGHYMQLYTPKQGASFKVCSNCLEFAVFLKESWLRKWLELPAYFDWVKRKGLNGEVMEHSPGTGYRRGGLYFSNAANHPFQHLASMGAKEALWRITENAFCEPFSPLYGARPALFIHDEIICELPEERASDAAKEQARVMVDSMKLYVPDVKISAEPALMTRWYKEAEPVYTEDGGIAIWKPKKKP